MRYTGSIPTGQNLRSILQYTAVATTQEYPRSAGEPAPEHMSSVVACQNLTVEGTSCKDAVPLISGQIQCTRNHRGYIARGPTECHPYPPDIPAGICTEDDQTPPASRSFLFYRHEDKRDQRVTYLFPRRSFDTLVPGQVPCQEGTVPSLHKK